MPDMERFCLLRDFGVRDAGCGKDWLLMQPMNIYGECAQAGLKGPFLSDGFVVETDGWKSREEVTCRYGHR